MLKGRLLENNQRYNTMSITRHEAIQMVLAELDRAHTLHPKWPKDRFDQAQIVAMRAGNLLVQCDNPRGTPIKTAVQVAAMAIRFLEETPGELPHE